MSLPKTILNFLDALQLDELAKLDMECLPSLPCVSRDEHRIGPFDLLHLEALLANRDWLPNFIPLVEWRSTYLRTLFGAYIQPGSREVVAVGAEDDLSHISVLGPYSSLAFFTFLQGCEFGMGIESPEDRENSRMTRVEYWRRFGESLEQFIDPDMEPDPDDWCFGHHREWGAAGNCHEAEAIPAVQSSEAALYWSSGQFTRASDALGLAQASKAKVPGVWWMRLVYEIMHGNKIEADAAREQLFACDWNFTGQSWQLNDMSWAGPAELIRDGLLDAQPINDAEMLDRAASSLKAGDIEGAWSSIGLVFRVCSPGFWMTDNALRAQRLQRDIAREAGLGVLAQRAPEE